MRRIVIFLGFFSFLFLVRADAIMLSPGAESVLEPVLFLAQQNQPPLDISGIAIIQAIPVGGEKNYSSQKATKILESIANLAVMQFDVEKYTLEAINPYTKEKETVVGGEFGRILRHEILGFNPRREILGVKHVEKVEDPQLSSLDRDIFEMEINGRFFDLELVTRLGRLEKGFRWGLGVVLQWQYAEPGKSGSPILEKEFFLSLEKIEGKVIQVAYYTIRLVSPSGALLKAEQWKFIQGNPNPVGYIKK